MGPGQPAIVEQLLFKDVVHGIPMVIPIRAVPLIPHAMIQSVGLAKQWTLDEEGNRKIKYRITQDLSYLERNKEVPLLINSRSDMDETPAKLVPWKSWEKH